MIVALVIVQDFDVRSLGAFLQVTIEFIAVAIVQQSSRWT